MACWTPAAETGSAGAMPDRAHASVEADRLVRAIERESGDRHVEALARLGLHLVASDHDARGCGEGRAAGVFVGLAGLQDRLLADHSRAPDFLHPPHGIGDAPMPAPQLYGLAAVILDPHVIGPDVMIVRGRGLVLEIERLHDHLDRARRR